jgi:hypothetical protein
LIPVATLALVICSFLAGRVSFVGSVPPNVDFSGAARDLVMLMPLLQQSFHIGSGMTSTRTVKNSVVPARAPRLFLAVLDGFGNNSNISGAFTATIF